VCVCVCLCVSVCVCVYGRFMLDAKLGVSYHVTNLVLDHIQEELPQHNIFDEGIYHAYTHNKTTGPDVVDIDHGGVLEGDTENEGVDETTQG